VLKIGLKGWKRTLTAKRTIECLIVPSYSRTSTSTTSGELTMAPVASVEKMINRKLFIV